MSGPGALLLALALAAQDVEVRVTAAPSEVELGAAFSLAVERSWPADLAPEEWSDQQLSPLVVQQVDCALCEENGRVAETRTFLCRAFSLEDVALPGWTLRVRRALPPVSPGAPELPGGPLPEPRAGLSWVVWSAAGLVAFALAFLALARRARRKASARAPRAAPHARALQRLRLLRERPAASIEQARADCTEVALLVRRYLEEQLDLCAPQQTSEEVLAAEEAAQALLPRQRARLAQVFERCDLVKFAGVAPHAPEHEELLCEAEAFVLETRPGAAGGVA